MVRISALVAALSMGSSVLATAVPVNNITPLVGDIAAPVVAAVGDNLVVRATADGSVPGTVTEISTSDSAKADVADAILGIVEKVIELIDQIAEDIERRKQFTQDIVTRTHAKYPGFNIVVCNVGYSLTGTGYSSVTSVKYKAKQGADVTFDVILFSSPKAFVRHGDGGYQNWAYMIGAHCSATGGTLNCPKL